MDVLCTVVVFIVAVCCYTVQGLRRLAPVGPLPNAIFALRLPFTHGGICWLSKTKSGHCRQIYSLSMSRDNCCSLPSATVSWSPHEAVSKADLFYWTVTKGGAPQCQTCHKTCRNVTCAPDQKCRVRRGQVRCVCSPHCPRSMKMQGAVCGSNRKSFKNYCAMLRYNCRRNREVRLSYIGRCKESCSDVKCYNSEHYCLTDQHGLPHCVPCNTHCSSSPVYNICGEDGNTYSNYCHLVAAICRKGQAIRVAYKGTCKAGATCSMLECPYGHKCLVNTTSGLPQCANCRVTCPSKSSAGMYLCGTDGVSYHNYCQMQDMACKIGKVIKTAHYGKCKEKELKKTTKARTRTHSWSHVTNTT